jgi:hypothetical protein
VTSRRTPDSSPHFTLSESEIGYNTLFSVAFQLSEGRFSRLRPACAQALAPRAIIAYMRARRRACAAHRGFAA